MDQVKATGIAATTLAGHDEASEPQLRQRFPVGRTASAADAFQPASQTPSPGPRMMRRRSSMLTDTTSGIAQGSLRSSTDDLLMPGATEPEELHQEPSLWYSLPLLFAVVPAIGGTVFKSGSVFITDLILLIIAAVYLNWCLVTPWVIYHSAQSVKFTNLPPSETLGHNAVAEEDEEHRNTTDDGGNSGEDATVNESRQQAAISLESKEAAKELRIHQLVALALCFIGPLMGSYILHLVRSQLSGFGDHLISDLHLTLFVLGAELRPLRHAIKLLRGRTLFLQKMVREDPHTTQPPDDTAIEDLRSRLAELEDAVSTANSRAPPEVAPAVVNNTESLRKINAALQTQIDALNRAVRRYEKRATAQTIQNEARMQELESRLKEALSLAAAAANYSQKPGITMTLLERLSTIIWLPFYTAWRAFIYPLRSASRAFTRFMINIGVVRVETQQPAKHNAQNKPSRDIISARK